MASNHHTVPTCVMFCCINLRCKKFCCLVGIQGDTERTHICVQVKEKQDSEQLLRSYKLISTFQANFHVMYVITRVKCIDSFMT